jgi:hypothetical protein
MHARHKALYHWATPPTLKALSYSFLYGPLQDLYWIVVGLSSLTLLSIAHNSYFLAWVCSFKVGIVSAGHICSLFRVIAQFGWRSGVRNRAGENYRLFSATLGEGCLRVFIRERKIQATSIKKPIKRAGSPMDEWHSWSKWTHNKIWVLVLPAQPVVYTRHFVLTKVECRETKWNKNALLCHTLEHYFVNN